RERIGTLLRHARGQVTESFIVSSARATIVLEARLHLAGYLAVALYALLIDWRLPLLYWILPALLGQPVLRAYLLAEHWGCPLTPDMLKNSRTTRSNALVRALAWNMPYHAEHHAYPALPFHALPKAHALLAPRIAIQAPGYLAVHREGVARLRRRAAATA
ncbi:MAG: fatty acid desaturase, partial [Kiloniellales bacterium]